jgi:hypothetical protein
VTSKSELKRRASTDPFWAAERIYKLEEQIKVAVGAMQDVRSELTHAPSNIDFQWCIDHICTALAKIQGEK